MPIRVCIYEDNESLRKNLALLIGTADDLLLCGNFANGLSIASEVKAIEPDVLIMDINMPGRSGIESVRIAKSIRPHLSIIMYTVIDDSEELFASLCMGADGYILKKSKPQDLILAIRDVHAGGVPMSPEIARKVIASFHETPVGKTEFKLTDREMEILRHLVHGHSYKQIAGRCHISIDTVRKHLQNIYTKLHVHCGTEAVAKALQHKIILL